jgi:hypothetical protein
VPKVELVEQLLGRSKVPSIISEQRVAKQVLLDSIQAFRVLRIQPLLQQKTPRSQRPHPRRP